MFAKIFSQIFDSSIAKDPVTRHVFMDLLILADFDGAIDMTLDAIARRTNMPEDQIAMAIGKLSEPDKKSRSKLHGGRRLIPIDKERDWGWVIVNYAHYRAIRTEESRKEYHRDYRREKRAAKAAEAAALAAAGQVPPHQIPVPAPPMPVHNVHMSSQMFTPAAASSQQAELDGDGDGDGDVPSGTENFKQSAVLGAVPGRLTRTRVREAKPLPEPGPAQTIWRLVEAGIRARGPNAAMTPEERRAFDAYVEETKPIWLPSPEELKPIPPMVWDDSGPKLAKYNKEEEEYQRKGGKGPHSAEWNEAFAEMLIEQEEQIKAHREANGEVRK